jgi:hypothetical protein
MNCAKHVEALAIGICCNCGRAVCENCIQSADSRKLACSPECAMAISEIEMKIKAGITKTNRSSKTNGLFSIAAGIIFLIIGLYHLLFEPIPAMIILMLSIGLVLFISGVFFLKITKVK